MLILYGIGEIVNAFAGQLYRNWGLGLAVGILDLVIGFILLGNLAWAADLLPYVVGFILMFVGIGFIGQSSQMQSFRIPNWGWVLTGGILTLIFAFLIIFHPLFGIFNIIVWTGPVSYTHLVRTVNSSCIRVSIPADSKKALAI